jgi:hypothetical protein
MYLIQTAICKDQSGMSLPSAKWRKLAISQSAHPVLESRSPEVQNRQGRLTSGKEGTHNVGAAHGECESSLGGQVKTKCRIIVIA